MEAKEKVVFFSCIFFPFLVIKTLDPNRIRIRISIDLKCWFLIRIRFDTCADPKYGTGLYIYLLISVPV